jgi:hypothetical protein
MNRPAEPIGGTDHPRFRMNTGLHILHEWADGATAHEKKVVYEALFAMTDRSLLRHYRIVDDERELSEFYVLLRGGLVIKMRVHSVDSFGLVYIGPRENVPGLTDSHSDDGAG